MVGKALRTRQGVLGMALTTFVVGGTHAVSWEMVTPARILISSFPSSASHIPSWPRMICACWGLQLAGDASVEIATEGISNAP